MSYVKKGYNKRGFHSTSGARPLIVKKAIAKEKKAVFNKAVKKVISKTEEKSHFDNAFTQNILNFNATGTTFVDSLVQISPANTIVANTIPVGIAQGSTAIARRGNMIRLKKAWIRLVMFPLKYNVSTNPNQKPLDIVMYIFKVKGATTLASGKVPLTSATTGFFQSFAGTASSGGFEGSLNDLNGEVNKDAITLHKRKVFKLGVAIDVGYTGSLATNNIANNDYKYNHIMKFDITKYLHKIYNFNDTQDTLQTATYLFFEAINADGSATTGGYIQASYQADIHYEYTDV